MAIKGKVLIIEDDRAICNFIRRVLEANGYECLCFGAFYKSYTCNLTDFTFIDVFRVCVLVSINPLRVTHKVIRNIRMDDCNIVPVNSRYIVSTKPSNNFFNEADS